MKHTLRERLYFFIFRVSAWSAVLILCLVLLFLLYFGARVLSWRFITAFWNNTNISRGGIFPAILGSLYLGIGVIAVSFPMGFATALFLTEYAKHNYWRRGIQITIRNLAGVPSVVYGMFGLAIFVHWMSFGTTLLSAILTLSIMALPWIITAAVESLMAVPRSFREASLALGATQWQTILRVVLPNALPGGITGGIIANARAMGETAPIILVGATFYLSRLPGSVQDKFMALPYHIFILSTQHSSPQAMSYAAGASLVLIATTCFLSFGAILLRSYLRSQKDW
jgi:phosphate transport system permease protein